MPSIIPNFNVVLSDLRGTITTQWFQFFTSLLPLSATTTLDFPSTPAGGASELTIALKGVVGGATVSVGVPATSMPAEGLFSAWVSNVDEVTIRYSNTSTTTSYDPASGSFTVVVNRP